VVRYHRRGHRNYGLTSDEYYVLRFYGIGRWTVLDKERADSQKQKHKPSFAAALFDLSSLLCCLDGRGRGSSRREEHKEGSECLSWETI